MIREEIAKRILGMIAAATIAGYGISEIDDFFQNNNHQNNQKIINETKTLVETILQKPENLLQVRQEQKKPEILLTSQFQYEYKPITKAEICSFYPDIKECKEVKDEKETKI
jgi:DNA-binding protein H-NS